jgi:fucose permease
MISGTTARVGEAYAANTIGMQMTATGLGAAVIPSLMGVLARQTSLEVIPVSLLALYAALAGCYVVAMRSSQVLPAAPVGARATRADERG